ncbi:DMT family transporter [Nakamurella endophytica]|uniref:Membrane protein n=1 Tax=Nakamurella endophytica TaxID=1748367 RepID=A0A917SLG4_9ACTN|nr:DMT family transporter [Nakamurella endophytica]GGL87974.1 membrane protein [Nakamurella endophytica]
MSRRGWLLFVLLSVLWGLPYPLIRVAVEDLPPSTVVFARVVLATVLLVPVCVIRGWTATVGPVLRHWRPLLLYTAVEIAAPWLLLTRAERELSSSLAGILVACTSLVAAVLARVVAGRSGPVPAADRLDRWRVTGLLVGFAGVLILLGLDVGHVAPGPMVEVLGVVLCYAVGPMILARRLSHLPGLGVVTVSVALTALGYLPAVLAGPAVPWGRVDAGAVWSLVGLGALCTALAFMVFFELVAEAGPARAVVITYVNPAVALVLGITVLSEPLTTGIVVGFPLILLGCILGARRTRARAGVPDGPDIATGPPADGPALAADAAAGGAASGSAAGRPGRSATAAVDP